MNNRPQQYSRFPAPPNAYIYTTTPYQTPPTHYHPYSSPLSQSHHSQSSSYFPSLPQGSPASQRQPQPASSLRQVTISGSQQQQHNVSSSLPSTPGNGPGAPPPERHSPSEDDDILSALQNNLGHREGQQGPPTINRTGPPPANDDDDDDDDDQDVADDGPVFLLPPPPAADYANEVELEKAIHAWSLEHGYELVRRASKKNANGQLYKRYYHCSKHGKQSNSRTPDKDKVRVNRKSNRMGCPMSLAAVSINPHDATGNWQIRLRRTYHNHPAVEAKELAGHRRRARVGAVENAVDGLFAINTSTNDVLKFLQKTHPEGLFKRTDVANMKLKWKKYGSCAHQAEGGQAEATLQRTPTTGSKGYASACEGCRKKKTKCDSQRPSCGTCVKSGAACRYDHASTKAVQQQPLPPVPPTRTHSQNTPSRSARPRQLQSQATAGAVDADTMQIDDAPPVFDLTQDTINADTRTSSQNVAQVAQIQQQHHQIQQQQLAALVAYRQDYVKPARLDLNSSEVERLACSTCANGDSYKFAIPQPFSILDDWKRYKEAFEFAATKENCIDVLQGHKREPDKPMPAEGETLVEVEVHNEYIKQLAIFKRRNEMLKLGFRETLAPALWARVRNLQNASEILIALDDMCSPRGADQAYTRFQMIHDVTLQACGNSLDNYIHTLELKWGEYNELANTHESSRTTSQLNMSAAEVLKRKIAGNGTFPEEMLCFLFLKNLGPQHQGLAANLCKKNNIGGFGSGERCGFKELWGQVKRSLGR